MSLQVSTIRLQRSFWLQAVPTNADPSLSGRLHDTTEDANVELSLYSLRR